MRALAVALSLLLAGCGAGSAAVAAGGGGGAGSSNAPTVLSGFAVEDPKVPPATIRFVLTDPDASQAEVELLYQVGGGAPQRMTHLAQPNPASLATSKQGTEHEIEWSFAAEDLLPDDARYEAGVRVWATVRGGIQQAVVGSNAAELGLGNDRPSATVETPADEVEGVVPVRFQVADSSDDAIDVRVEYDVLGDDPDAGWRLARPGGLLGQEPTPERAFEGVTAPKGGAQLVFFWDTGHDLSDVERDVALRFTPIDPVTDGLAVTTDPFRVDNNEEPIADLEEGLFLLNPDQRRGIPVPFEIADPEGDLVQVVFQWRRAQEAFPPLPQDPAQIAAILADPELRLQHHVCSEFPRWVDGRVVPLGPSSLRLSGLGGRALALLADGVEGSEIEILRASSVPAPLAATWTANPLVRPVAALPAGDETRALVLDSPASGAWRLREIELATGAVAREIASGSSGDPSAMALEPGERTVVVASDAGGAWRVDRVDLASGGVTQLAAVGSLEPGTVRGIAPSGSGAALITVGSSLVRLDYADSLAPRAATVMSGLATPWGVALDPLSELQAFVAERDAALPDGSTGRVIAVDLARRSASAIVAVSPDSGPAFLRPSALALDRSGTRLLVASNRDPSDPRQELRGVELGASGGNRAFPIAETASAIGSIAVGAGELRILALPDQDDLAVGGGVEQRRTVSGFEARGSALTVAKPFEPAPAVGQRWRIADVFDGVRASPAGTKAVFVWDSGDLPGGGLAHLEAVPYDSEVGVTSQTGAEKRISSPWDGAMQRLTGVQPGEPRSVRAADLDGDGDLDLVAADGELKVFFQVRQGEFDPAPSTVPSSGTLFAKTSVQCADVDGDGDIDLIAAGSNGIIIFPQIGPGVFGGPAAFVPHLATSNFFPTTAVADLDGDGDLDLANAGGSLKIFLQAGPLQFVPSASTFTPFDVRSVQAVDIDGDGDIDLLTHAVQRMQVYMQSGGGVFDAPPFTVAASNAIAAAPGDIDGDGDLDLVLVSYSGLSGELRAHLQVRPGEFDPSPVVLVPQGTSVQPNAIAVADVDRDGDADLVTSNYGVIVPESDLTIFLQARPGVFDETPVVLGGNGTIEGPIALAVADLDRDGGLDLASVNTTGDVTVFFQRSRGAIDPAPTSLGSFPLTVSPRVVLADDLDADGDADLVSSNAFSGNTTVFAQTSPGAFDPDPRLLEGAGGGNALEAADLDGDLDLDLISIGGPGLAIHYQVGPGVFERVGVPSPGETRSIAAGDLNGDGAADLVVAKPAGNLFAIHFQSAAGMFGPASMTLGSTSVTKGPRSVELADLDQDGDLDIVTACLHANRIFVFFQLAPGAFGPPIAIDEAGSILTPAYAWPADLDQDGDIDVACANLGHSNVSIFFQIARGQFDPVPARIGDGSIISPEWVAAADLDGDGDQDLVSANDIGCNLAVFFQRSPGRFDTLPRLFGNVSLTNGAASVVASDIDGDGDPDLGSVNYIGNNLTIFWGGR